jgi:periplasmic divalent cation tolerance protein
VTSVATAYVTAPPEAAERIARTLVEERLAACVNSVDCDSVYRWDGAVHEEGEVILLAKTTDERYPELCERVLELHPHDVPCIERFEEEDVLEAFAEWRAATVGDG